MFKTPECVVLSPALEAHAIGPPVVVKSCIGFWVILFALCQIFAKGSLIISLRVLVLRWKTIATP